MKPRFSLKTLFALTTLVAAMAWYVAYLRQPSVTARQFESSFRASSAAALKVIGEQRLRRALKAYPESEFTITSVAFEPQSWRDWVTGKVAGTMAVEGHWRGGRVSEIQPWRCQIIATRSGIDILANEADDPMVAIISDPPFDASESEASDQ